MKKDMLVAKSLIRLSNPWHFLATGFGSGMFYWMPGSMGSLVSILFWYFLMLLPWKMYFLMVVLSILLGFYSCHKTVRDIGIHDHVCIVLDEFIGMWITLTGLPINNWYWVLIGFFLFRLLDIWKPWPICWFDHKIQGGIGIVIDDLVAGIIAAGLLSWTGDYWLIY